MKKSPSARPPRRPARAASVASALPVLDLRRSADRTAYEQLLTALRESTSAASEAAGTVSQIIADVRACGDEAVVAYMRKWTNPAFNAEDIRVPAARLRNALRKLDPSLRAAMETAIQNVRTYQEHIKPKAPRPIRLGGATLGMRFTPVESVGLAVPGGKASYPSSVIMLAVPAMVAGVPAKKISVITPPPTRSGDGEAGDVSDMVLAACAMLGIERVYRIGGAQAVAALALGTQRVGRVALIAGPGNVFVQLAKAQLSGMVGTDNGFYGPSEVVVLADASADPARVASDLLAQAEHDPGRCFLVTWSRPVLDAICEQVAFQLPQRRRREAIEKSLRDWSAALLVKSEAQAVAVADELAAEHVSLAVKDPQAMLTKLRFGGEFFLGDQTPVAAGDYLAGPSHCLPTGCSARFTSGVSVYTFLNRSGLVTYPRGMSDATIDAIAALAEAEGLDGHAASARTRRRGR